MEYPNPGGDPHAIALKNESFSAGSLQVESVARPGKLFTANSSLILAGGFIADELNRQIGESRYDYLDFYMGTIWLSQRADLTPVYEMIFRRLKERMFDWHYRFAELGLIEFPSDKPGD